MGQEFHFHLLDQLDPMSLWHPWDQEHPADQGAQEDLEDQTDQ